MSDKVTKRKTRKEELTYLQKLLDVFFHGIFFRFTFEGIPSVPGYTESV